MLRNIIFDMGGVLIRYEPEYFVRRVCPESASDREILLKEIFCSEDWKLNDRGDIDEAELEKRVMRRIPAHLHDAAHRMIYEWDRFAAPIEGMAQLVRDCKAAGLGIYLLSNASRRQPEYWVNIPGSEYFDDTFVSAFYRCLKPSGEIFRLALEKFGVKANECPFVDDMPGNAEGAMQAGLDGFHFTGNADKLRESVRKMGAAV
jgi:putative hydrolase of the HAD superfamily